MNINYANAFPNVHIFLGILDIINPVRVGIIAAPKNNKNQKHIKINILFYKNAIGNPNNDAINELIKQNKIAYFP